MIVPGYGMAVAQAQHVVKEITENLRGKDVNVRFAIHPVAGRLPGHMNVLLAEANVPYDIVFEMDEVNDELPEVDVLLVIGANDIVNPSAQEEENSPLRYACDRGMESKDSRGPEARYGHRIFRSWKHFITKKTVGCFLGMPRFLRPGAFRAQLILEFRISCKLA